MRFQTHKEHNRAVHQATARLLSAREIRMSTDPETVELVSHVRSVLSQPREEQPAVSTLLLVLLAIATAAAGASTIAFFLKHI